MTRHAIGVLLLVCAVNAAVAQTLYKCANTYSQAPCSDQAQALRVYTAPASQPDPGPRGFALCVSKLPVAQAVRARAEGTRRVEVIRYAGQAMAAQRFDLVIDARDSGLGPTAYRCWLSEDQARVLQFEPRP